MSRDVRWTPAWNAAGTSPSSMPVISASSDVDICPAVAKVSSSGPAPPVAAAGMPLNRRPATCVRRRPPGRPRPAGAHARPAATPTARQRRRPPSRQRHRQVAPAVVLGPGDVEVLQQNPPGHRVDGQVVNDEHQLAGGSYPQGAEHDAGGRVQPGPRARIRAASDSTSTVCRHSRASTTPGSGTCNDQPPGPSGLPGST